jgi:hypothetical protein
MKSRISCLRAVGLAACVCALTVAAPTAVAQPTDAAGGAAGGRDLRSPDARDAALAAQQTNRPAAVVVDLRAPDTRDAARGVTTATQSVPAPAPASAPTIITVEEHGGQTLAIVFSACALLIALLAVGFVAVFGRPRQRWTAP